MFANSLLIRFTSASLLLPANSQQQELLIHDLRIQFSCINNHDYVLFTCSNNRVSDILRLSTVNKLNIVSYMFL